MIEEITLKNAALGQEILISKHTGSYWLEVADLGTVSATNNTFKFIDQIGETLVNTTLDTRAVTISGWVANEDENIVKALKAKLNKFVEPRQPLELWFNDYKLIFSPSTSIRYATDNNNNEIICKFLISGIALNPLFETAERTVKVSSTEGGFYFPWVIPTVEKFAMGVRQPSLIAEITNDGAIETGYKIEFIANAGIVVNPQIFDIGTQQFIKINKTLQSGESIVVDTRRGTRGVKGYIYGNEYNYFQYRDFNSSWLELSLDKTFLRWSAESGEEFLIANVYYAPRFLEVDT